MSGRHWQLSQRTLLREFERRGLWFRRRRKIEFGSFVFDLATHCRVVNFLLRARDGRNVLIEVDGRNHNQEWIARCTQELSSPGFTVYRVNDRRVRENVEA